MGIDIVAFDAAGSKNFKFLLKKCYFNIFSECGKLWEEKSKCGTFPTTWVTPASLISLFLVNIPPLRQGSGQWFRPDPPLLPKR